MTKCRTTKIFKISVPHSALIGRPFNSEFDIISETDIKFVGYINSKSYKSLTEELIGIIEPEIKASNKELYDTNTSQKLTPEEIEKLKDTGVAGKELVQELLANSTTFDKKTAYSQEKYIKKKEKKYVKKIFVYNPTVYLLAQYYFNLFPSKIGNMRFDTLSLMLHLGDVQPGNNIIINENLSGLMLAAAAERMYGEGTIQYIYHDNKIDTEILNKLNLLSIQKDLIIYTNMNLLMEKFPTNSANKILNETMNTLKGNAQGLLIANLKYHPIELIKVLWNTLSKSGAFVIYHQYLQPLVDTQTFIRTNNLAISINIQELWMRKYQVLKDRTHPEMMNEHAAGGYLLYGYKINEYFT